MVPYFPKQISNRAVVIFLIALAFTTVFYFDYSMSWGFILLGIVWVSSFFILSSTLSKGWRRINDHGFTTYLVILAIGLRLIWVIASYFYYIQATGSPFEFGAADSMGYHGEAEWCDAAAMPFEKPLRALYDAQMDSHTVPADLLGDSTHVVCFPDHSLISFVRTEEHPFFPTGEEILEAKRVWSAETLGNIEFQSATEVLVGDETGTYNWGRIKTSTHVYFIQRSVYSADDALDSGGNAYAWTLNDQTWQIFESSDREGIGRYLAVTSGEPFNLDESSMKHED